jgi:hypothetical protein
MDREPAMSEQRPPPDSQFGVGADQFGNVIADRRLGLDLPRPGTHGGPSGLEVGQGRGLVLTLTGEHLSDLSAALRSEGVSYGRA